MRYLTDRKRAIGMGAAKSGTEHHWSMQVSSVALLILVPLFIFTFGCALGGSYEEITAYYARPFPAIIAALTIWVGMMHFKSGAQIMLEDYVHGFKGRLAIILMTCLSYAVAVTGVYALVRLAL
ncbi:MULTISPECIES: succinate dehydrogenase, hydrophobic membrane anchor protein [Rhodobacterales]|jgi:succinate dehydrogenase / fumarate reductase membrane anchor subunit|uniref:Succinate dehydrogenase hydrophobic membrane anchor subunit n=1 Tax=Phaeobacter gallaeciensis TaxID=60890 RepID=A0A1B0ZUA7_9RHOB|nr:MULTISPECIES: succinate dehydrogenase, hydrophobic membrane anchor protein [Phaeobacter]MDF1772429.1 succinate dehydrogenase, hydrophobic membrane anchor protein [Pseudophaeobacter sp. bin_em_oilr2.035]ANP37745.1 succinate dehydrogenase [Phaeobacter gallaeciensis]MDE4059949.1 succinate dehydrogenase, hydrophobic membrane anchor protein [Phaeobacter gallaeciensis]MDE4096889.1 succinate dehydrogenase, hydrophobic membrane anchor protein [Phaeobacter gallaeciensis]MDE4105817.1 succinate dehydr